MKETQNELQLCGIHNRAYLRSIPIAEFEGRWIERRAYYAAHGGDVTDLDKMAEQAVGAAWFMLCSSKNMTADDHFFEPIPVEPHPIEPYLSDVAAALEKDTDTKGSHG